MDPSNPMARLFYVWVLVLNRRTDAIDAVLKGFPVEVRDTVPARLALFLAHAQAGHAEEAHAAVTPEIQAVATAGDVFPRIIAQGYGLVGMSEQALHWLAIAVDRGFINYPSLAEHDPFFEKVRGEPRFQKLLKTVRERWEKFEP
jgi:hypothetical protein